MALKEHEIEELGIDLMDKTTLVAFANDYRPPIPLGDLRRSVAVLRTEVKRKLAQPWGVDEGSKTRKERNIPPDGSPPFLRNKKTGHIFQTTAGLLKGGSKNLEPYWPDQNPE